MISAKNTTRLLLAVIWVIITYVECYGFDVVHNTQQNMALVSCLVVGNLVLKIVTLKWCRISLISFFFAFIFFYIAVPFRNLPVRIGSAYSNRLTLSREQSC